MELRQLRTFVMAAEFESFTRAAEAMAVTQPAVSQQIAALEHDLGMSLFHRQGRTIQLTEAGQSFYRYSRQALELLERAKREIGVVTDAVSGSVRIASCTVPPETFLPPLLAAFHKVYPEVRESVSVSDTAEATRAVETGSADLGFVVIPPSGSRLRSRAIICHQLVLVVAPGHRLAGRPQVDAGELRGEPFVLREVGSGTRRIAELVLQNAGISPADLSVALETNSNEAIRGAVREGTGIGFLLRAAVQEDVVAGRLVVIGIEGVHPRINSYLLTDPDRFYSPAARAFLSFVESTESEPSP